MRIHSVTLACSDLGAQAKFWAKTIGLPVRWDGDDALELPLQASVVRLEANPEIDDPRYHFAINIPPGSISDAAEWVSARHDLLAFHGDPDEEEGATIVRTDRGASTVYFLDAGGNVVELIANRHLDEQYSGAFTRAHCSRWPRSGSPQRRSKQRDPRSRRRSPRTCCGAAARDGSSPRSVMTTAS